MTIKIPEHVLEIDEEGFPLSDGLRIEDEEVLRELFTNIKHLLPQQPKSPLISTFGGIPVLLNAFDEALVVQSIDWIDDERSRWVFPGDVSFVVSHKNVYVDPWNRFHTLIEPENIFAVLSRKAQGYFLNRIRTEEFKPKQYMHNDSKMLDSNFWSSAYVEKKDGWELGEASPVLKHFGVPPWLDKNSKILVPGAGRGHDAVYFESKGLNVTALDLVQNAVEGFRKIYPLSKIGYLLEDFFSFSEKNTAQFDAVFEHTIFCAIDPTLREKYLRGVLNLLKPQGTYFGIFFREMWLGGPPFGMTQWQLRELTQKDFLYRKWEISLNSIKNRQGLEIFAVMQKR